MFISNFKEKFINVFLESQLGVHFEEMIKNTEASLSDKEVMREEAKDTIQVIFELLIVGVVMSVGIITGTGFISQMITMLIFVVCVISHSNRWKRFYAKREMKEV